MFSLYTWPIGAPEILLVASPLPLTISIMRVFVYRNLHKKLWSVRAMDGPDKGRVIQHATKLSLANCTFKVSESGRQRVIREKRKNVHAGVQGTLIEPLAPGECSSKITYDPYRFATFVDAKTLEPVHHADMVKFEENAVFSGNKR